MIEFDYKLPSMNIKGRHNGTYNNKEMVIPCCLTTKDYRLGEFLHQLNNAIHDDRSFCFIDGKALMVSKNWIRDHVHEMKGFKHWEYDLRSFLEFIIETQREDGQFYELIKQMDDCHWKMVDEDCRVIYPEDNLSLVRLELEADIEYLVVEGVMQYYRATGDFDWVESVLPKLERGIDYITSAPDRFDAEHGLVMRPFTIDTWDFTNDRASACDRRIHENEPMSIMHGDNSGVFDAMNSLAWINDKLGNAEKAAEWRKRAEAIRENMMKYLWNGKFFIHQLHLGHDGIDDRESERISLSNTYDMNRGVTDLEQSRSIISEYISRRETTAAFSEFFSIDPPYERFMTYAPGKYVNGAISPFTAGELAKAAFNNGFEEYGWDIIQRFMSYMERDGDIYFLYSPEDMSPQDGGPSAWGAAALLSAVDEGLAGIVDEDSLYRTIKLSPRFVVTDYTELRYITGYECSHTFVDLRFVSKDEGLRYDIFSKAERIDAHILLPKGREADYLLLNGERVDFTSVSVAESKYVDLTIPFGNASIEVIYQ